MKRPPKPGKATDWLAELGAGWGTELVARVMHDLWAASPDESTFLGRVRDALPAAKQAAEQQRRWEMAKVENRQRREEWRRNGVEL